MSLHQSLRDDLTSAMRSRDRDTVRILRTVLAAIGNAEAQPGGAAPGVTSDGPIAGAVSGLGATEVARRDLTDKEVRDIVTAERDDYLSAGLDGEARLLGRYLN